MAMAMAAHPAFRMIWGLDIFESLAVIVGWKQPKELGCVSGLCRAGCEKMICVGCEQHSSPAPPTDLSLVAR